VVVDSSERRTGIASALMQSAFSLAIGAGCYKLQLLSGARRADAHGLYESVGMDAPVRGFRRYF
jgi:GNAT superfamily N-acetyltransferase